MFAMSTLKDLISTRLGDRHLFSLEISRLIKDVSNIIATERDPGSADLKKVLSSLGWEEDVLDYRTMELISVYLEDEWEFEMSQHLDL
jgi:hypothetical protein